MERFLHRRWDGCILDVDEFQVAKCLLAGETELLSQEVDSGNTSLTYAVSSATKARLQP